MFENQISTLGQFQGIQLETDISVITLDDEINHTYCSKVKWEKDNRMPIGIAQLIMPYSIEIASYWMKYPGAVVIHANINSRPQALTQAMMENFPATMSLNMKSFIEGQLNDEENAQISAIANNTDLDNKAKARALGKTKARVLQDAQKRIKSEKNKDKEGNQKKDNLEKDKKTKQLHLKNDEYNYAYIGKVARFKQVGKTFIVYLEDLGWKFMQKVPKEFRDAYIAGQSLDDAFQAICEFMGVEFAYSIEDLNEYNFGADGYSVEKDGQVIEDVSTVLSEWANKKEEDEEEKDADVSIQDESMAKALNHDKAQLSGLHEYNKKKKSNNSSNKKSNNSSLNSQITNQSDNDENNENTEEQNKEEDNQKTVAEKIGEYQEEFDEKIKNLFIGNTLYDSNISDPILNYDWITITPKAPQSTSTNTAASTPSATTNTSNTNNNSNNSNKNGWINGQYYINGKIYLYTSYINSLPPGQAEQKYIQGQNTYTRDTLSRLLSRAAGNTVWT